MNELEVLDKKIEEYIESGIDWNDYENEVIITADKSEMARGDVEQFASDAFQHGWMSAKAYFESKK